MSRPFLSLLSAGLKDRFAVEIRGHVARPQGDSFEYESTAPGIQFRAQAGGPVSICDKIPGAGASGPV